MKAKGIVLVAILLVFITSSSRCVNMGMGNGITGSKNFITRDFKVGNFNKVNASVVGNINYTQSTDGTTTLELYGPDNIVELVKVEIKDNTLLLSMKKKNIKKAKLRINISSPDLKQVKMEGVGDLVINDKLETSNFMVKNSGVGNVTINEIICNEMNIRTEGVGSIQVKGKADKVTLITQGVGSVNAADLVGRVVRASSEGVGNISCQATEAIDAETSGIGSISYKGNPKKKQLKKEGIGSIKQK